MELVSAPIDGFPPVKVVAAQGLHDVALDPDFARNRTLYFTYFAPPPGEEPALWPTEFFYDQVWTKSLAERRRWTSAWSALRAPAHAGQAKARKRPASSPTARERRIVFAPDGTLLVTGADRFRFYDSDLDGVEHDFTDNPDVRRNFSGRVIRINRDGSIPKDNPWLGRATVAPETFAHGLRDPEGAAINPATGELWATDHGPQGGDEINIVRAGRTTAGPTFRTACSTITRRTDGRKNVPVGNGRTRMEGVEEPSTSGCRRSRRPA